MNIIRTLLFVLISFLLLFSNSYARRGCCSHHGGVCGSTCCDGTPLSPACRGGSSSSSTNGRSNSGNSYPAFCFLKSHCYEMSDCNEAMRYFTECNKRYLDGDGDGIPCEQLCLSANHGSSQGSSTLCWLDQVIDGDTIYVWHNGEKIRVRLVGIDTPEKFYSLKLINDAGRCGVPINDIKRLGELASNYITSLISNNELVCEDYGYGYYGRSLMMITTHNLNVNEAMVANGYACVYQRSDLPEEEKSRLNSFMENARVSRLGLWGINYGLMSCLCGYSSTAEDNSFNDIKFRLSEIKEIICNQVSAKPIVTNDPQTTIPFGLGDFRKSGIIDFKVAIPRFQSPVDVYLGVLTPESILLVLQENNKWGVTISPWIRNTVGGLNISLEEIDTASLPKGEYTLYLLVVPFDKQPLPLDFPYYLWVLKFNI